MAKYVIVCVINYILHTIGPTRVIFAVLSHGKQIYCKKLEVKILVCCFSTCVCTKLTVDYRVYHNATVTITPSPFTFLLPKPFGCTNI